MALRDWLAGVATLATSATVEADSGRSVATVATVATGGSPTGGPCVATVATVATLGQSAELRELLAVVAADWSAEEQAEALAAALADPESALRSFRALVAERGASTPRRASVEPTCRSCANLAPGGRCLAAWRGESFGRGIATSKTYAPSEPNRPLCCGPYVPGPNDPDRRSGRERWPYLFEGETNAQA